MPPTVGFTYTHSIYILYQCVTAPDRKSSSNVAHSSVKTARCTFNFTTDLDRKGILLNLNKRHLVRFAFKLCRRQSVSHTPIAFAYCINALPLPTGSRRQMLRTLATKRGGVHSILQRIWIGRAYY